MICSFIACFPYREGQTILQNLFPQTNCMVALQDYQIVVERFMERTLASSGMVEETPRPHLYVVVNLDGRNNFILKKRDRWTEKEHPPSKKRKLNISEVISSRNFCVGNCRRDLLMYIDNISLPTATKSKCKNLSYQFKVKGTLVGIFYERDDCKFEMSPSSPGLKIKETDIDSELYKLFCAYERKVALTFHNGNIQWLNVFGEGDLYLIQTLCGQKELRFSLNSSSEATESIMCMELVSDITVHKMSLRMDKKSFEFPDDVSCFQTIQLPNDIAATTERILEKCVNTLENLDSVRMVLSKSQSNPTRKPNDKQAE